MAGKNVFFFNFSNHVCVAVWCSGQGVPSCLHLQMNLIRLPATPHFLFLCIVFSFFFFLFSLCFFVLFFLLACFSLFVLLTLLIMHLDQ